MSSKNLKVYKMQFITEVRKLTMNVKFACQMKMTWKRSNECAETSFVPLQGGVANFSQTLKLKVNMYFDTTTNKFVQKKCLYGFLISTDKGEKSAGSVSIDLAEFFNKRIYQLDQAFTLEKCPVNGSKIQMKIHYEEQATEQAGYDSMSCISATNQMDSSVASVDLGEIAPTRSNISQKSQKQSQGQTQKSSERQSSKTELQLSKKQQNYGSLDVSDVLQYSMRGQRVDGTKIGENIKSINNLTVKINQFVTDKSKNIRYEIEGLKRKVNSLEEQLQGERIAREKIENQLAEQRKNNEENRKEQMNFKTDMEHKLEGEKKKNAEIEEKYKKSQLLLTQMEAKMSESGSSQSAYIQQLKANQLSSEAKFGSEIEELRQSLVQQKRGKNELSSKVAQLQGSLKQLKAKYEEMCQKNEVMQDDVRRKQGELQITRINLEKAFQNLVNSLNGVV